MRRLLKTWLIKVTEEEMRLLNTGKGARSLLKYLFLLNRLTNFNGGLSIRYKGIWTMDTMSGRTCTKNLERQLLDVFV